MDVVKSLESPFSRLFVMITQTGILLKLEPNLLRADLPINSDTYKDETGEVQPEGPREHHEAAHQIASQPLHRARPGYLQGHHEECHLRTYCVG